MSVLKINAGSRLHFGLICGTADSGWQYGGLGLMIDQPSWSIAVQRADQTNIHADEKVRQRIQQVLDRRSSMGEANGPVDIRVEKAALLHNGLGSGTQLTLAIATALEILQGNGRPAAHQIAEKYDRARRSCVGTRGFDRGGLIVDRGRHVDELPECIEFPTAWKMVLVAPEQSEGMSGPKEERFFGKQPPLEKHLVSKLAHLIENMIVPAVHHRQYDVFAAGLAEYGTLAGDFYADEQGGLYSSPLLSHLAADLEDAGYGAGVQSSWGPTICYPCPDQKTAESLQQRVQLWDNDSRLRCIVTQARNRGADFESEADVQRTFV